MRIRFSFGSILMRKSLLPVAEVGEQHSGCAVNVLASDVLRLVSYMSWFLAV